jgi:hypothetical protein
MRRSRYPQLESTNKVTRAALSNACDGQWCTSPDRVDRRNPYGCHVIYPLIDAIAA